MDCLCGGEQIGVFIWITKARYDLMVYLADYAFRVYGYPTLFYIKENVVVLKIAMQQPDVLCVEQKSGV